jgi:pimeloyl-ACP methyl ester carboxylesterase
MMTCPPARARQGPRLHAGITGTLRRPRELVSTRSPGAGRTLRRHRTFGPGMPVTGQATMIAPIQLREGFVMPFVEAPVGALVHFVDLDLHSEALHLETAEPVVLIHGLGCDWRHWSRQIGWLAHSRRVIVRDVRGGAGKTRWARPGWSMAEMAADIHAVTVHLGLRRPALAGISMGGMIALQYALDRPGTWRG